MITYLDCTAVGLLTPFFHSGKVAVQVKCCMYILFFFFLVLVLFLSK